MLAFSWYKFLIYMGTTRIMTTLVNANYDLLVKVDGDVMRSIASRYHETVRTQISGVN